MIQSYIRINSSILIHKLLFSLRFIRISLLRLLVSHNLSSSLVWFVCLPSRCSSRSITDTFLSRTQVLTQEDWNEVLYNGMEKTSAWAALYFIALMTFGNYVLFNLLVAILVEGFSTEVTSIVLAAWDSSYLATGRLRCFLERQRCVRERR